MHEELCVSTLCSPVRRHRCPVIFNGDQGSQFTGETFTGVLRDAGVRIGMDGKGGTMDSIMVHLLWRSVKYQEIHIKDYQNVVELLAAMKVCFEFYNHRFGPGQWRFGRRSYRQ